MEQEHRITYKAGITRTPSDFLCQDGELAECINLATDNEELKPVVQPESIMYTSISSQGNEINRTILYVHKFNEAERYIFIMKYVASSGYVLAWGYNDNGVLRMPTGQDHPGRLIDLDTDKVDITSIGKTLIVNFGKGINYFLWTDTRYNNIGDLPTPKASFYIYAGGSAVNTASCHGIARFNDRTYGNRIIDQESYNDLVVGLYSKSKNAVLQKKCFTGPFLVRCALEMYDGSYTKFTNPVMLFPVVHNNCETTHLMMDDLDGSGYVEHVRIEVVGGSIGCDQSQDYTAFSDVVKDVAIFVTEPIELHDLSVDQGINYIQIGDLVWDSISQNSYGRNTYDRIIAQSHEIGPDDEFVDAPKRKDVLEITEALKSSSIFYKLCTIGIRNTAFVKTYEKIQAHTLENLRNQEHLEFDDFYSNTKIYPSFMYAYNSRLNIANVSRGFFEGFHHFLPYDNENESHYYFYVKIKTDTGSVWIRHYKYSREKQGLYFFYPDSRATHVTIYKKATTGLGSFKCVLDADLTEHPGLNGAFYFENLPAYDYEEPDIQVDPSKGYVISWPDIDSDTADNSETERLSNYIITSEVNNPWVFNSNGYNKVGTGKIIGMSTITQALSQGQFGQYPLLVFSESGIWAMSVDRTGLYQSISPMSRDVCINPGSILQTDGAVFFVSKKGLMVVAGNEVVCVSERMNGATFNTAQLSPLAADTDWEDIVEACQDSNSFLDYIRDEGMFMAYDYIDSRIVMVNPRFGYSFIYNIADATISKVILPAAMTNAVNNYPDYLIQGLTDDSHQRVYSFYGKKREEEVTGRQQGFLLTRPMKLSGPTAKASLRQLMHVGMWNKGTASNPLSCVKTEIWLSDNLQTWYSDISRFGTAAKYYRLALYIKMLPTERLSGTILTEQPRRTKNLK